MAVCQRFNGVTREIPKRGYLREIPKRGGEDSDMEGFLYDRIF